MSIAARGGNPPEEVHVPHAVTPELSSEDESYLPSDAELSDVGDESFITPSGTAEVPGRLHLVGLQRVTDCASGSEHG